MPLKCFFYRLLMRLLNMWLLLSFSGHSNVVKLLVENGADVNAENQVYHYMPLHYASKAGLALQCLSNAENEIKGNQPDEVSLFIFRP